VYTPFSGGRNFLGVVVEDTELGARVTAVTPNGPAASAGVLVGDTIVAIDGVSLVAQAGQPSTASQTLLSQVADTEPGAKVDLRVLRGGDYRDVEVTMRGDGPRWFSYGGSPQIRLFGPNQWTNIFIRSEPWADFEFVALTPALGEYFGTNKGLLIVHAPKDDTLGFRDGDVILDIGGREPQSPEHAFRILGSFAPGESLRVSIMRKQARQSLEIKIPGADENV
jgi:S1-C subfamily serine protease